MFDLRLCNFIDGPIKTIQETDYIMLFTHTSDVIIFTFYHPLLLCLFFKFYSNMINGDRRLYLTTYIKIRLLFNDRLTHYFLWSTTNKKKSLSIDWNVICQQSKCHLAFRYDITLKKTVIFLVFVLISLLIFYN